MADGEDFDDDLEQLLEYLWDTRAFDFRSYKRGTLGRRIAKRMEAVGVEDYGQYQELLEAEPHEFIELFNTILINVTEFLRDRDAWAYIATEVIPAILESKAGDDHVRVWSAGCASGEEAYSVAVLLCEALGEESFRDRVKVYGTDADEDALTVARQGRYPAKAVQEAFTREQVERHFESDGTDCVFRKDLRRSVIFGRHDLLQDPPISRVDLLLCRNTLMYFNSDAQQRILHNFHFALNPGGYLFLGRSEALVTRTNLFVPTDPKRHVFVKRAGGRMPGVPLPAMPPRPHRVSPPSEISELAFEDNPVAQIVVDRSGTMVAANRHARTLFGLGLNQIGRPFKDIELSYRPIELRSRIEQVLADRRQSSVNDVPVQLPNGATEYLDILLLPLTGDGITAVGLTFVEVGRYKMLRDELQRSQRELEAAYEELQSINEELETTNEELETMNEELHSTNEELETMNEELHSANEELETTNNELRQRTQELDEVNAFLESILGSLGSGVIVLNRRLAVRVWNRESEDTWGLRADEVLGEQFLGLDIGLPVDRLSEALLATVNGESPFTEVDVPAVNRRGKPIDCQIRVSPLYRSDRTLDGVILLVNSVNGER